jgi:hypothetical protein
MAGRTRCRLRSAAPVLLLGLLLTSSALAPALGEVHAEEPDGLPSLQAILNRYVMAVGGPDAILALHSRTAQLRCITDLPSRTPPVLEVDSLSVWSLDSGEFLVAWRTARGDLIEGFDGDDKWTIESGSIHHSDTWWGPRDQWLIDPQFPLRLTAHFPAMELVGMEMLGDEWLYLVDVDGRESHRLGFSVDTGLLTRLGYNKELRDYAAVDGVLTPMRVVESRKGGSSTFVFDAIRHNEEIDPQVFSLAK